MFEVLDNPHIKGAVVKKKNGDIMIVRRIERFQGMIEIEKDDYTSDMLVKMWHGLGDHLKKRNEQEVKRGERHEGKENH